MIMFAMSFDDPGVSAPNCSFFPETLRLEVPRKDDYYVRDVAVQVAYICPKLRRIAHRLSAMCDEFEEEFVLLPEDQKDPPSVLDSFLNWLF